MRPHISFSSKPVRDRANHSRGPRRTLPVDGYYPQAVAVRDLARYYQLAWVPVENKSAEHAIFSPPVTPEYNGDCEAASEIRRAWGHLQPTPNETWSRRQPIDPAERAAFVQLVRYHRDYIRTQQGIPIHDVLDHNAQAEIDRQAIRLALVEQGFLTITRR
jgi:hypothetical protein